MYCKNCNKTYTDNDRFCTVCGSALEDTASAQTADATAGGAALVRKHTTSKLFLTATIVFTLSILATLVSLVLRAVNASSLLRYAGMYSYSAAIAPSLRAQLGIVLTTAFSQTGAIICALGLWLHYRACRKAEPTKTAGLTVLKIMQLITAIMTVLGVVLLFMVLFFVVLFNITHPESLFAGLIVLAVVGVITLPILVLAEIYCFKNISAINKTKKMLKGETLQKMPLYCIVYNFIAAGIGIFSGLFLLFDVRNSVFYWLGAFAMQLALILYTVVMVRFNADVNQAQTQPQPPEPQTPSEAAASLLMQDADEIIEAQVDNEETIEDMPQA